MSYTNLLMNMSKAQLVTHCQDEKIERDRLAAENAELRELLGNIRGNINPERGFAEELEKEIDAALAKHKEAT